ncbi:MAG TPA: alpha/beta fold hydrolase [Gaiellaceae bacterium]
MRRVAICAVWVVTALTTATPAHAAEVSVTMNDGVRIDASLLAPSGAPPAGGWPAVMMFHGLGGNHLQLLGLAQAYVAKGFAVFAPDARGHGTSGGFVSLDGPREVADVRTEFQWLASRPEISDTQIGAWGNSLGGGAAWNSVVAGVPFKALETFQTWSDLYSALYPSNLGKSGAILAFSQSVPAARIDPTLLPFVPQMIANQSLPAVRDLLRARSSLHAMSTVTTPSFLFQGRRDFVFDIGQAVDAYRRLVGPKRLYVGDFGHSPSTFPGPDLSHMLELSTRWFERFLQGAPNGVDTEEPVQIATDPWNGRAVSFAGVPRVRLWRSGFMSVRRAMGSHGRVVKTTLPLKRNLEQFGAPLVNVTASTRSRWPHLVAVVTAVEPGGRETVLTTGGTLTSFGRQPRSVRFQLVSDANLLRRGTRLRVYLGATSTVQNRANLLYLNPVPDGSSLRVATIRLTVPVLPKTISG